MSIQQSHFCEYINGHKTVLDNLGDVVCWIIWIIGSFAQSVFTGVRDRGDVAKPYDSEGNHVPVE